MPTWRRSMVAGLAFFGLALAGCGPKPETAAPTPADVPAAPVTPASAPVGDGHPALWKLADEDTTIYLFGTVHVLKPETKWRSPELDAALARADTIWTEADVLSQDAQVQAAQLAMNLGTYGTSGGSLAATLDDGEEKEVREALDILGVPFAAVDGLKPWMAGLQIANVAMMKAGYSPGAGVETTIISEAGAAGKELQYFESVSEQIRFFANLPEDDQIAFLVAGAESIEDDPGLLDRLIEAWAQGDVAEVGEMMSDIDEMGSQRVYDELLVARNARWVPRIEAMLDEPGTVLVAVGAGHLAGPDSVIAMLRAEGHTVEGP